MRQEKPYLPCNPGPSFSDQIHPDNLALAVRATRLLHLDVAGIDFLSPNPAESWLEGGAAICEVNAQPGIYYPLHTPTLKTLLGPAMGRIPVVLVLSDCKHRLAPLLHQHLRASGHSHAALVSATGWWVGEDCVSRLPNACFAGARNVLADPAVTALVLDVSDGALLNLGWPVTYCDLLVVAPLSTDAATAPAAAQHRALLGAARHQGAQHTLMDAQDNAALLQPTQASMGLGNVQVADTWRDDQVLGWMQAVAATVSAPARAGVT